jgi:beta-galactosidase/beta-glucuronidase
LSGQTFYRIVDEASGLAVSAGSVGPGSSIKPGTTQTQTTQVVLTKAKLWHFDHPNLYRLELSITGAGESIAFLNLGIRKLK